MTSTSTMSVPALGSGLGFRRELGPEILAARDHIDVLEIVTEQFLDDPKDLAPIVDQLPVIPHGVALSIGTAGPLDYDYLRAVKAVSDISQAPYYSDHLAVTRTPGIDIGHLSPVWFTEEVLRVVISNVHAVQDFLRKPLVLENISYVLDVPGATMTQGEFFTELVAATGCGLLLDVANVHINSQNFGFDAVEFLDTMPLHALAQIHLAGGFWNNGFYVDGHCEPVDEATWHLLDDLVSRVPVLISIVEQDDNLLGALPTLLADVERARTAISDTAPAR